MRIDTLRHRKNLETERRVRAASEMADDLRAYARDRNGRFVLFGSFVAGLMRYDSDLDVMIDFDRAESAEAWRFVEQLGRKTGLDVDLHDASMSKATFVERVLRDGLVLR